MTTSSLQRSVLIGCGEIKAAQDVLALVVGGRDRAPEGVNPGQIVGGLMLRG